MVVGTSRVDVSQTMIDDRNRIFDQLRTFVWKPSVQSFGMKLGLLEKAISRATWNIGNRCFEKMGCVHLALSGGVDSTLLLYKFIEHGFPVVAHTMASHEEHPDLVHARQAVNQAKGDVRHEAHLREATEEETRRSNRLLGMEKDRPDNYLLLMEEVHRHTHDIICGDCIDEMMGGYYRHLDSPTEGTFQELIGRLIPNHLIPLDRCSSLYRVRVHLPYADTRVLDACQRFYFQELIVEGERKKPICELARQAGVPGEIIERRKRGLVSALEV
jgi:asparagine synthetase B (glutamine-hydrolysing)